MSRTRLWWLLALGCIPFVVVGCVGEPRAGDSAAGTQAVGNDVGALRGTVHYTGPDPDTAIAMSGDPKCAALHQEPPMTRTIVGNQGRLANVFIHVKSGLEGQTFPAPTEAKVLDQEGCLYQPRVLGVQVGQPLKIINSDETLHNVHARPSDNQEVNEVQPMRGMELVKTFDKPEVMVPFTCNVHPWMQAWVGVVSHPFYAVSEEDGSFVIDDLPPGTYTLEAWHETLGPQQQQITVEPGRPATVSFEYRLTL